MYRKFKFCCVQYFRMPVFLNACIPFNSIPEHCYNLFVVVEVYQISISRSYLFGVLKMLNEIIHFIYI